jgi:hypothetical protein
VVVTPRLYLYCIPFVFVLYSYRNCIASLWCLYCIPILFVFGIPIVFECPCCICSVSLLYLASPWHLQKGYTTNTTGTLKHNRDTKYKQNRDTIQTPQGCNTITIGIQYEYKRDTIQIQSGCNNHTELSSFR